MIGDQLTAAEKIVRDRRFQRIVDFQKLVNLSEVDTIFNEFVRLSRLVCGAKYDQYTDKYEHPYDYDKITIIEDSRFGERVLTSFEPCLALSELHIIIPCRRCGFTEGVNCRLIDHLLGTGCSECRKLHRSWWISTESFILRSEINHIGNDVNCDYSNASHTGSRSRIRIKCYNHGDFHPIADIHMRGSRCSKCSYIERGLIGRLSHDEFINRAKIKHGNKFNYDKTMCIRGTEVVIITCPIHGDFEQTPTQHLKCVTGCTKCGKESIPIKNTRSQDEFITRSIVIHDDKYDYSKVVYIHGRIKIVITCPVHGDFEQEPNNHLNGAGCNQCGVNRLINSQRFSTEDFINKANLKHGDNYDYTKVRYYNLNTNVMITCPTHGDFEQTPSVHLLGCGCQKCAGYGFDSTSPAILYFIQIKLPNNDILYKLGITNKTVEMRYSSSDRCLYEYTILKEIPFTYGRDALDEETRLKRKYSQYLYNGEPVFTRSKCQEIFTEDIFAVEYIS